MALSQMYALTGGRRYKQPYVEDINARKQYLPQLYAQQAADKYRNQMYGLEQQGLDLRSKALKNQEQANKRARLLGYANIGLGGGLGLAGLASDQGWFDKLKGAGTDTMVEGLAPDLSSLNLDFSSGTQSPIQGSDFLNPMSYLDEAFNWTSGALKNLGFSVFDAGKGIYDSVVGDAINASDFFTDSAFNDLTGLF